MNETIREQCTIQTQRHEISSGAHWELYRERDWTKKERRIEKEKKGKSWYTKTSDKTLNTFPIFCTVTPKGILASSLRKIAEETREQSKDVVVPKVGERVGVTLKNIMSKNSTMETDNCHKTDCPV